MPTGLMLQVALFTVVSTLNKVGQLTLSEGY